MTREEITQVIAQAVDIAVSRVVRELAPAKDEISLSQAHRLWGRSEIDALVRLGKVSTRRIGTARNSKVLLSRSEILEAMASYTAL